MTKKATPENDIQGKGGLTEPAPRTNHPSSTGSSTVHAQTAPVSHTDSTTHTAPHTHTTYITHGSDWKLPPQNEDLEAVIDNELQFEPYDFKKIEIETIPLYIKTLSFSPCIHIHIGFRYGAMHDEIGKEGVAHFLEHMLFDGSSMFVDEKETQEFGKVVMLDTLNAHTSLFELFITGKCLPHNFDTAIKGIFSMIIEPKLNQQSYEHEKKVITQEAWGVFLNPKRIEYVKKERENTMYDIPDRRRIASALGWPETIDVITHEDIKNAHKKYFVKENMEIFIAGNIDAIGGEQALVVSLSEYLEKIPSGSKAMLPFIPSKIGNPKIAVFDHTYSDIGLSERQQASISLSSSLPRINKKSGEKNDPAETAHNAALELAGNLLSDIVYRKLRLENSWCYGAGASSQTHPDYFNFSIGGTINFNHIDDAVAILKTIIENIAAGKHKTDFEKTKRLAIDNTIARERNTEGILESVGESIRENNTITTLRESLLAIAKVNFEDVQKIIAMYFDTEKVFIEIVRPGNLED